MRKAKFPINRKTYTTLVKYGPVPCVDFVLVHQGKFLMGFRSNKPAQNQWWLPGGRIWKNETLEKAALRKAKEETGMQVKVVKFLLNDETIFKNSSIPGISYHSINTVFLVKPLAGERLSGDWQHKELQWFSKIDSKWHPYLKKCLRLAGFK